MLGTILAWIIFLAPIAGLGLFIWWLVRSYNKSYSKMSSEERKKADERIVRSAAVND